MGNMCSVEAIFQWPVRVYYEDTDAGGVVYHSQYLNYMERARTEWLRSHGIELDWMAEHEKVLFVVNRIQVDYRRAARFNDALTVTLAMSRRRRVGISFEQTILRPSDESLLIQAQVEVACVQIDSFRPTAIPESFIRAINP